MSQQKKRKALKNRNGSKYVSDELREDIIKYFNSTGDSLKNIGDKFGMSHTCVHNIITKYFKKKA